MIGRPVSTADPQLIANGQRNEPFGRMRRFQQAASLRQFRTDRRRERTARSMRMTRLIPLRNEQMKRLAVEQHIGRLAASVPALHDRRAGPVLPDQLPRRFLHIVQ